MQRVPSRPTRPVPSGGVDYFVLGRLQAVRDGVPLALGGPRQRLVLAVLLAHANRVVPQDALIDAVWSGEPPEAAKSTLHGYVSVLRRELGGEILRQGDGYCVAAADDRLDAARFERLVGDGRDAVGSEPHRSLALLQEALALWYGHAYGDLGGEAALAVEVLRLEELRLAAVEARVEADLAVGNHAGVVGELESLIRENPYRERLRVLQMLALYRCGRQAEALGAYERTRVMLGEELGIDPAPELRRLQGRILNQDADLELPLDPSPGHSPPVVTTQTPEVRSVRGYELRGTVGAGARGVVHRAYQPSVGREVAVKVLDPELANRPEFVQGFEARARAIAQLEHPRIVGLLDYWRDPRGAYLVMPFKRGGSLAGFSREDEWESPEAALRVVDDVGQALSYAHSRGIVHGHVNPGNVLLDEERNAYLSDFDVDGAGDAPARSATSAWCAPETVAGEPSTPRSDVFGLGALASHVLGVDLGHPAVGTAWPGLPSDVVDVLARATAEAPVDRFDTVEEFLASLHDAVGVDGLKAGPEGLAGPTASAPRNPYKGLRSFTETDAADFFGRAALVDELVAAVRTHPLVAVVGPSGSGKSSVVRAGLVPALRSDSTSDLAGWLVTDMIPGSSPFEELEAALLRVAVEQPPGLIDELTSDGRGLLAAVQRILPADHSRLLLIIDQFEELFTAVAAEPTRLLFLDSLVSVARDRSSRVTVVLTVRADYFDRPLEHPEFGRLVSEGLVTVTPPSVEGLAQAVVGPAHGVGLQIEPGLVDEILRDAGGQPGALPLLQYALTELFESRAGTLLTVDAYRATGGAVGALSARAEALFGELSPRAQEVARQLFLRMVTVDDLAGDARRRVRLSELTTLPIDQGAVDTVLRRFGDHRLLSFDRDPVTRTPTVEVAHEALLRQWPRLADWIDSDRENLIAERRVNAATGEWEASGGDPSFLLRGGRLEQAERWAANSGVVLSSAEAAFLTASEHLRDVEALAVVRRRRGLISVLAAGLAVALVGGLLAVVQRNEARQAETTQVAQRVGAQALLEPSLGRSLLLARQAVAIEDSPETRGYLFSVLLREPKAVGLMYGASPDSILKEVAVSPDGRMIALADELRGSVFLFDASTFEQIRAPLKVPPPIQSLAFSPDGAALAVGGSGIRLLDVRTGRELAAAGLSSTTQILFSADGSQVYAVNTYAGERIGTAWITIRDAATLQPIGSIQPPSLQGSWVAQQQSVPSVALTDEGRSLIIPATDSNEIGWWGHRHGRAVQDAGARRGVQRLPGTRAQPRRVDPGGRAAARVRADRRRHGRRSTSRRAGRALPPRTAVQPRRWQRRRDEHRRDDHHLGPAHRSPGRHHGGAHPGGVARSVQPGRSDALHPGLRRHGHRLESRRLARIRAAPVHVHRLHPPSGLAVHASRPAQPGRRADRRQPRGQHDRTVGCGCPAADPHPGRDGRQDPAARVQS